MNLVIDKTTTDMFTSRRADYLGGCTNGCIYYITPAEARRLHRMCNNPLRVDCSYSHIMLSACNGNDSNPINVGLNKQWRNRDYDVTY